MRRRKPTTDVGVPLVVATEVLVMRRREVIAGVAAASALSRGAWAQMAPNVKFILWVSTEAQPDPFIAGFRDGMRERGYVEGQNLPLCPALCTGRSGGAAGHAAGTLEHARRSHCLERTGDPRHARHNR